MTPKEFAAMLRATQAFHEQSYDEVRNKYRVNYGEAASVCCDEKWIKVVACLLTAGYSDVWEWCDEMEKENQL